MLAHIRCSAVVLVWMVLSASLRGVDGQELDERVLWLRDHAVPVRSVDPKDEDFSDLAPLVKKIGDARVVQLGEPRHGDGAVIGAKVRLVKFLHKVMGFDVLVWDAGMYDCQRMARALRTRAPLVELPLKEAASRGVVPVWAATEESLRVFAYARSTYREGRPLDMAGFDCQFSGMQAERALCDDLLLFFDSAGSELLSSKLRETLEKTSKRLGRVNLKGDRAPTPTEAKLYQGAIKELLAVGKDLMAALDRGERPLVDVHGLREVEFYRRVIANLVAFDETGLVEGYTKPPDHKDPAYAKGWSLRERTSADNLIWIGEKLFPGRKLIVWGHSTRMMNAYYPDDFETFGTDPKPGGLTPMGAIVRKRLGEAVYNIAFVAHHGRIGFTGNYEMEVPPPAEGSLEDLCHQVGRDYLFVDFREVAKDSSHWLHKPIAAGPRGYKRDDTADWTRVFDAMFFIDKMFPSTPVRD